MKTDGVKKDAGKPRTDLLSAAALMGVSEVLKFGAEKYAADNWRLGMNWRRLIGHRPRLRAADHRSRSLLRDVSQRVPEDRERKRRQVPHKSEVGGSK